MNNNSDLEICGKFRLDDQWVWCGSPVCDGEKIHLYASSWSKEYPMFEGYVLHSRIVRAVADAKDKCFRLVEDIFPDGELQMAHNPAVRYFNGKWYMYFIAAPAEGGRRVTDLERVYDVYRTISIYLAVSDSPAGPWVRKAEPILTVRPGMWDSSIVTNPAPCILADGRAFLYYRSNTPEGLRIGLAVAPTPESQYVRIQDEPVLSGFNVEDPFVWHDGSVFRMVAKDMTGEITGEVHAGAAFSSENGTVWQYDSKAYSRNVSDGNGGRVQFGSLERPQMLFDANCVPEYLFAAVADGPGGFRKAENTWNTCFKIKSQAV